MLSDGAIAVVLLSCLGFFILINSWNIVFRRKESISKRSSALNPSGVALGMVAVGTLAYFFELFAYCFLVLGGFAFINPLSRQFESYISVVLQFFGLCLTLAGYLVFNWSVIARGRYAVSWSMSENHRLVTSGPYRYVRHPSYLGYILMFVGLPLMLLNPIALIPLVGVPGYYFVTSQEERLLVEHFGEQYVEYRKRTGRFLPKIR
ncbi:MAG: isoprenylcysteine carboxylmethyltransferase family protein [Candidatus Bathyarchaeota archaeon]|nr:isoprenylcysteine carboxylmethyltransferase family protein [Candidatus Bathyarchaeota archaeon]